MINRETIDKITDAARIDEVVGDFVHLKKRGTSLIGNCPFHQEKTPSFHVSVSKGIFKCFGCGIGGDAISFVMEHEKYSYPEALKFLASKYNIEVEETEVTPQDAEAENERESLFIVSQYAANFFVDQLWRTEEGQGIGLSYFKERGFREDILKKFEIGYSPDSWDALTTSATAAGHQLTFLEQTGLSIKNDNGKIYDRFRGRVIFPIHNFTGRVIAFGGRTLKTDKKVPKYVNSVESDIYHKSKVLYGLFQAKKAIRTEDNCYLVEGYADVLSVHQAGIENVVASSGTSLTAQQIALIGRFTKNVTILFDGDAAGIKASLRGLDMILEEGLNVKIVSFPDGHDPDSYMHHVGASAFKTYIETKRDDFILYKARVLLAEAGSDPIKRAEIIKDIVESIAKIPDEIKASVFVRESSRLLEIEERVLLTELNKIRSANLKKNFKNNQTSHANNENSGGQNAESNFITQEKPEPINDDYQEREVVRLLLAYGNEFINWDNIDDMYVGSFVIQNLSDVTFENETCAKIISIYKVELDNGRLPKASLFLKHEDADISNLAITLLSTPYTLSENWENKHNIFVRDETMDLKATILGGLFHLKKRKVENMLLDVLKQIKLEPDGDNQDILMQQYSRIKGAERDISKFLGSVIVK